MKIAGVIWLIYISVCACQHDPRSRFTYFSLPPITSRTSSGFDDDVLPADDQQFRRPISNSLDTGDEDDRLVVNGASVRVHSPIFQPFLLQGLTDSQRRFVQSNPQSFVPFQSHNVFPQTNRRPIENNFLPNEFRENRNRVNTRTSTRPLSVYRGRPRDLDQMLNAFDYEEQDGFGVDFDFFRTQPTSRIPGRQQRTRDQQITRLQIRPQTRNPIASSETHRTSQQPRIVTQRPRVVVQRPHRTTHRPRTITRRPRVVVQRPRVVYQQPRSRVTVQRPRPRVNPTTVRPRERPKVRFIRIDDDRLQIARPPPIDTFSPVIEDNDDTQDESVLEQPTFTIINDAFHFGDIFKTSAIKKTTNPKKAEENVNEKPKAPKLTRRQDERRISSPRKPFIQRAQVSPTRQPRLDVSGPRRAVVPRTQIRPTRRPELVARHVTSASPPATRKPSRRRSRSRSRFARRRRLRIDANRTRRPAVTQTSVNPDYRDEISLQNRDFAEEPPRQTERRHSTRSSFLKPASVNSIPGDTDDDGSPGAAQVHYPIYDKIPKTSFSCSDQNSLGYYADQEAQCQVFHFCQARGVKTSFLCPNGTIYNQQKLACEWWYNVDCKDSQNHYGVNDRLYKDPNEDKY